MAWIMVVERYRSGRPDDVGARFRERGRMLPPGVKYEASWLTPSGAVCYQLRQAPSVEALAPWLEAWADLVDFELVEVTPSQEFWAARSDR